jgi:hypothetical protein
MNVIEKLACCPGEGKEKKKGESVSRHGAAYQRAINR